MPPHSGITKYVPWLTAQNLVEMSSTTNPYIIPALNHCNCWHYMQPKLKLMDKTYCMEGFIDLDIPMKQMACAQHQ